VLSTVTNSRCVGLTALEMWQQSAGKTRYTVRFRHQPPRPNASTICCLTRHAVNSFAGPQARPLATATGAHSGRKICDNEGPMQLDASMGRRRVGGVPHGRGRLGCSWPDQQTEMKYQLNTCPVRSSHHYVVCRCCCERRSKNADGLTACKIGYWLWNVWAYCSVADEPMV
jgi:hypothetical protein